MMRVSTPLKTRFTIHMHVLATPLMGTDLATRSALVITDVMDTPTEDSADTAVLDSVMAHTQDTAVGGTASALRLLSSTDAPVEPPALALRGDGW